MDDRACPGKVATNGEPIYIGARGGAQRWLLCALDELYVFDVALTDEEIVWLAEGGGDPPPPPPGPGPLPAAWGTIKDGSLRVD